MILHTYYITKYPIIMFFTSIEKILSGVEITEHDS